MRAVFEVDASPPAQDGSPCMKDAVMVALTCLAQYAVQLAKAHQRQQSAVGPPATGFPPQATRQQSAVGPPATGFPPQATRQQSAAGPPATGFPPQATRQQSAAGPPATGFPPQATRQPQQQAAAAAGTPRPISVPMPMMQAPLYPNVASTMVSAHKQGLVHVMTWIGKPVL